MIYQNSQDGYYDNIQDALSAPMEDATPALADKKAKIELMDLIINSPEELGKLVGFSRLTPMHGKWIKDMWDDLEKGEDRSMQAHRGSYKTSSVTQVGGFRQLLIEPDARIAILRYTVTDSVAITRVMRNWFKLPVMEALLTGAPFNMDLRESKASEDNLQWEFKSNKSQKEGNLDSWGITGSLTGYHYDYIMCCDIVTMEDRISNARRDRVRMGLREVRTNIKDPDSHVLMEGTPWHQRDAWVDFPPMAKYDVYTTGLLDEAQIKRKKDVLTTVEFGCNYELEHLHSEDQIFATPTYAKWIPLRTKSFIHIDAKYDGDHAWALTLGQLLPNGKWQMRGWSGLDHIDNHTAWIIELCVVYNVREVKAEYNADKGYFIKELKKRSSSEPKCRARFRNYTESMNKHVKIQTFGKANWGQVVWCDLMQDSANYPDDNKNGYFYMTMITDYIDGEDLNDSPDSFGTWCREFISDLKKGLWS